MAETSDNQILKIGIMSRQDYRKCTIAIAKGEYRPSEDEPKLWFESLQSMAQIHISMDGRGRTFDNIFIERFWRNLKHEDIYLKGYDSVPVLIDGIADYIEFYNEEWPHQALDYLTPLAVYRKADKDVNGPPKLS